MLKAKPNKNRKIKILRRMVIAMRVSHQTLILFKIPFLLFLLLVTSEFHQAEEKTEEFHRYELKRYLFVEETGLFSQKYLDYIEENIDVILARSRFNGSILISRQGQILYEKYFGLADLRNKEAEINSKTVFQLASVGKQFTAMAVMMLKERGYFEFDDHVCEYIQDFPYPDITIRHLLNHTSGLQNYMYLLDNYWREDYFPSNSDLTNLFIQHNLPLNFTPGRRFSYSNTGYAFLALLVENVSGGSFHDFMRNELFIPLGMNNTFAYCIDKSNNINNRAFGFSGRSFRRFIPDDAHDGIMGDKGFFSTARDLYRWDQALTSFPPVSKETMQKATTKAVLNNGRSVNYGFGWRLKNTHNHAFIYHHGWWHGFRTAFKRIPEKEILIVIMNNTNSNIGTITRQVNNIVLSDTEQHKEYIVSRQP